MTSFTPSPSLLRVLTSCTHDMQFICLDGNIVPSWKSLVSIFSEDLATLLEDIDHNDGMVSVSVSENSETVLTILSAIEEKRRIICIEENQTKMVSCNSEDLLNLADEKGETHDIKIQINSEMLVKEERDAAVKHIKVTPE